MDWTLLTIQILEAFKNILGPYGSWGFAIILLTIVVRLLLIPLSISQQRSMKKMQELSPKLKQLQTKYKSDPQKLQMKMMEFYKENKFNPFGGCFPLLLQMPIFILLYTTLISPVFLQMAGPESFFFVNRLDATLQTYSGPTNDNSFNVKENDSFITGKYHIKVKLADGTEKEALIKDYRNSIKFQPKPLKPGEPVEFTVEPEKITINERPITDLQFESANIPVVDNNSKEIEHIDFTYNPEDKLLHGSFNTVAAKSKFNFGVCLLLILFAVTMWGSQKIMMGMSSSAAMDPQQKAMQETMSKMMPLMILAMFVIIPIPAGVLLYMVVSNIFQVGQTIAINKYLDVSNEKEKAIKLSQGGVIDVTPESSSDDEDDEDYDNQNENPVKRGTPKKESRKQRKKKRRR